MADAEVGVEVEAGSEAEAEVNPDAETPVGDGDVENVQTPNENGLVDPEQGNGPEVEPEAEIIQLIQVQHIKVNQSKTPLRPDQLPIAEAKDRLVFELKNTEALIIIGETGCGKTTQVPKYILEAGLNKRKMIAVTQPRRVAAIQLSHRVAQELGEEIGGVVGYSVRFDENVSKKTKIKFMTDGMLLREGLQDPMFNKYSHIVLDEVHERTINSDLLLGLVQQAQVTRSAKSTEKKQLKVVVMSATMDVDKFSKHFENSKVVYIEGRQHDVEIMQTVNMPEDYCYTAIQLILKLHQENDLEHSILAFLTGQFEIESAIDFLQKSILPEGVGRLEILPLYAALSNEEQYKVMSPVPEGTRRVIISTNIAETSLTIPNVRFVIDCGYVKAKFHEYGLSRDSLGVVKISKAQAMQRTGRAGREGPGVCYRLYSREFFAEMEDNTIPEIMRVQISSCILHLLQVGIMNPFGFNWIDPPKNEAVVDALDELLQLEAIKTVNKIKIRNRKGPTHQLHAEITEIGSKMIALPLEPTFARILISSSDFRIVEPMTCVMAILCSENIFHGYGEDAYKSRLKFSEPEGDIIMYLKIFREFKKAKSKFAFCQANCLSYRALSFAARVRDHLLQICKNLGLNVKSSLSLEETKESIRLCFFKCMRDNVAVLEQDRGNDYRVAQRGNLQVKIHPVSILHNKGFPRVIFTELSQVVSGVSFIKHIIAIDSKWV